EFESMPGKTGCDRDIGMARMAVEDEMLIRAVGEHAGSERGGGASRLRKIPRDARSNDVFVGCCAGSLDRVGVHRLTQVVPLPHLETGPSSDRHAIKRAFGHPHVEDWKALWLEQRRHPRLEPTHDL